MEEGSKGVLKYKGNVITDKNNCYKNYNIIKDKWTKKHFSLKNTNKII